MCFHTSLQVMKARYILHIKYFAVALALLALTNIWTLLSTTNKDKKVTKIQGKECPQQSEITKVMGTSCPKQINFKDFEMRRYARNRAIFEAWKNLKDIMRPHLPDSLIQSIWSHSKTRFLNALAWLEVSMQNDGLDELRRKKSGKHLSLFQPVAEFTTSSFSCFVNDFQTT